MSTLTSISSLRARRGKGGMVAGPRGASIVAGAYGLRPPRPRLRGARTRGVVARQNFTCCQTCGHAEIGDEIAQALTKAEAVGYTFYHMQDTERAAEGGGLFLAYGSLERTEAAQQKVGWTIVEALRREGLAAEWNGDVGKRIEVKNLLWRRRRKFT